MMVGFSSMAETGCTFFSWSYLWFLGQNYYNFTNKTEFPLVSNPLSKDTSNAHEHKILRLYGIDQWKSHISDISNFSSEKNFIFKGNPGLETSCNKSRSSSLRDCINFSLQNDVKIVYFSFDHPFFRVNLRSSAPSFFAERSVRDDYILLEMKNLFKTVPNLDTITSNIGKARDFLSFNMKKLLIFPDEDIVVRDNLILHKNFHLINYRDWINSPDKVIKIFFDFLDKKINKSKYDDWMKIHSQWKKNVLPVLLFFDEQEEILDSIVEGKSFCLRKYSLNVLSEAYIQYQLMKRYNNRLLVTHLDSFPNNTLEITKFLKKK
jgi:hypothetical protein